MSSDNAINTMITACIIIMGIIIFIEPIKKIGKMLLNGILGLIIIYLSNIIFMPLGISVGINIFTFIISALLGIPGVISIFIIQAIL